MTRRVPFLLALISVLGIALPATAQTPAPPSGSTTNTSTPAPIVNLWYIGGATGVGVVDSASAEGNIEAGMRIWKNLDLLIEGGYAGNLATRREEDHAATIAGLIQATQGSPVTSSLRVPSSYAAFGARWVFESTGRYRPYVLLSVGGASVNLKPKFVLNGADVTGSLSNFGITLGSDLSGSYRPSAVGGGVGILMPLGRKWYFDGSIRLLSVNTAVQRTNLSRLSFGMGRRF
jgi:hypothetical protein